MSDFIITDKSFGDEGPQILSCVVNYKYSDIVCDVCWLCFFGIEK